MPDLSTEEKKLRLLFVDDEPLVLQGLRRSLRGMSPEWSTEFANSGSEALEKMAQTTFDVVVTDMRMPGMDGGELLQEVEKRHPDTVRIVLSGQSSREALLRSIGPSHQYLSKPCDVNELKARIGSAFLLRDLLGNSAVKSVVSRLTSIPSLPTLYKQMMAEIESPDPSSATVAAIIAQDAGMTAKVLQLANSALLGLRSHISNAHQAVLLIGLEMMRSLVVSVHIFSHFEQNQLSSLDLVQEWKHSLATANIAQAIARCERASKQVAEDCFTAGLLHDIGKLILARTMCGAYKNVLERFWSGEASLIDTELATFGCTHAQVGAYLIGIWGLPSTIVEAIAWHHAPSLSSSTKFDAVTAVHVADALAKPHSNSQMVATDLFDQRHLETLHLSDRMAVWLEAADETIQTMERKAEAKVRS
jgi:putative nucleotidyltransferase with HDIG domain